MVQRWRWNRALREHQTAVREFLTACGEIAPGDWQRARVPEKWTPAAVVLHVCRSYELGRDSAAGGESMRLKVSPRAASVYRTLILPVVLATHRFPRGARAPREVRPDTDEASLLLPDVAVRRLQHGAEQAAEALRQAAGRRPAPRFTHAYFGPLGPLTTLRLLSAHTAHHRRDLAGIASRLGG